MLGKLFAHLRRQWMGALALFLVLSGGSAYALAGHNSVSSDDIKNGQVKPQDLARPEKIRSAGLSTNTNGNCAKTPNQWAEASPAETGPLGYYRDADGTVHLNGAALNCEAPSSAIFKLPPGYRPQNPSEVGFAWSFTPPLVRTTTVERSDGSVIVNRESGETANVYILDGIDFRCGPPGKHGCP